MNFDKTQLQRLDFLIEKFKNESNCYINLQYDDTYENKRLLLRSLMNIRLPNYMDKNVLKVQDEFLQREAEEKGIVKFEDIPTVKQQISGKNIFSHKLSVWQGDITRLQVGAIVNAANSQMLGCFVPCHRCIDNAIHSSAGIQLREECNNIMNDKKIKLGRNYQEPVGTAVLTKGYNLPAEYVIHTVGPIVNGRLTGSLCKDLINCYKSDLLCALEHNIRSVAFCCISTGEFHFPNDKASEIAVNTVTGFLKEHNDSFDRIIFNVFMDLDRDLYIKQFI